MDALCSTCLCSGRNLYLLTETDLKNIYDEILHEIFESQCGLRVSVHVCWECHALLRRFQRFRVQVKSCYMELVTCLEKDPSSIPRARQPRLQLHRAQSTSVPEPVKEESDLLVDLKSEKEELHEEPVTVALAFNMDKDRCRRSHKTKKSKESLKKNGKLKSKKRKKKNESHEEQVASNGEESGLVELCDGESFVENGCYFEEVHLGGENPVEDRGTVDGFCESDDEPLEKKRSEKKTGRQKKKETEAPRSRPKREKPAGVVTNVRVARKLQQLNVAPGQLEMVVLGWDEVEAERQRALASETFTRHQYRCENCAVGFNHRCKLDDHMKKHDPSAGEFECSACLVRCRDSHALAAHRRRHRVRWRCTQCGGTWSRAAVAADHAARAHGGNTPTHACNVCGHLETTLGKLRNHMKSHAERQRCELCGKTFRDRTSLRTHLFIHRGEKEYACARCDKRFLFKRALEVHLVTHMASAHLYCHQCDMNFKNRMSYNQHMKYNLKHIDPARLKYACDLCNKKFVKATRLEEHKLAVHLKMTPIQCTVPGCNFACSSRPVLRTHVRMLHRDARARRNHVCDVCGKAYTTKKSLEGHLRTHTGERPFRCARCPAAFGYEATLYNHNKLVHLKHKTTSNRALNVPPPSTEAPPVALSLHSIWP